MASGQASDAYSNHPMLSRASPDQRPIDGMIDTSGEDDSAERPLPCGGTVRVKSFAPSGVVSFGLSQIRPLPDDVSGALQ